MSDVTEKERLMLPLIAAGLSNAEIGKELGCSGTAAGKRISNLMSRWGAFNRAHLVHLAYAKGLLVAGLVEPMLRRVPLDPPEVLAARRAVLLGADRRSVEPVPLDEFTGEAG